MNPELDKLAADIVEGLLIDLGDTFKYVNVELNSVSADLYGWKVARAEALADRLKQFAKVKQMAVVEAEFDLLPPGVLKNLFAMQAPEVPGWFVHVPPPGNPGPEPMPILKSPEDEEGYDDLPHHEQWAKRQVYTDAFNRLWKEQIPLREAHSQAIRTWNAANAMARLTQWRWHYADQMLAARNPEPQPDATVEAPRYDPTFGDDALCACGHPYYRHFDTHEDMAPVGCKYCYCDRFQKEAPK